MVGGYVGRWETADCALIETAVRLVAEALLNRSGLGGSAVRPLVFDEKLTRSWREVGEKLARSWREVGDPNSTCDSTKEATYQVPPPSPYALLAPMVKPFPSR